MTITNIVKAALILFVGLGTIGAQESLCPSGWTYINDYGCYYFSQDLMTWEDARQFCLNKIGILVIYNTFYQQ